MKILVAGDFAPQKRLAKQIAENRFDEIFDDNLCNTIKSADCSFVNFECPVAEDNYKPIVKCGPNLHCTPSAVNAIKFAGFTGVTMANNHILDFGEEGLYNSIECCKAQGLDVVGVGKNLDDAEQVLYLEKSGVKLAVINCCEHEFSIASNTTAGANPLNPIRQFYAIQEAKKKANYVLVIVHGGHELFQLPSPRMVETYRFFIDAGADAVVNHHQHCYSGYETYKGKTILYGLGNFCFDEGGLINNNLNWNYGYMALIEFSTSVTTNIFPYIQYADNPTVKLLDKHAFDAKLNELNSIIGSENELSKQIKSYYNWQARSILSILEPYRGRALGKLFRMGLLPSFIKGKKRQQVINYINCEAHRDKLSYALNYKHTK